MRTAVAIVGIAAVFGIGPVASAVADETAAIQPRPQRRAAEILSSLDDPHERESWLSDQMHHVHVRGKAGLVYQRDLAAGDRPLELQLRGPALGRKRVGLSVEVRF